MKEAIAIINVPDDADINDLCITFDLERMLNQDGDVETIWGGIGEPLRPLPQKAEGLTFDYAGMAFTEEMAIGWNSFRDAILGEEKHRNRKPGWSIESSDEITGETE